MSQTIKKIAAKFGFESLNTQNPSYVVVDVSTAVDFIGDAMDTAHDLGILSDCARLNRTSKQASGTRADFELLADVIDVLNTALAAKTAANLRAIVAVLS